MTVFPSQAPTIFIGTVLALRLIEADDIRRRLYVFHDVPLDHRDPHHHDRLHSSHMVTMTMNDLTTIPLHLVRMNHRWWLISTKKREVNEVVHLQSIHLRRVFITSCQASRLLNGHSRRMTLNQTSPTHSITHHQGGFHV